MGVTGLERHVSIARADYLPYPVRAIRTSQYLLVVNFAPDRWPAGDPFGLLPNESLQVPEGTPMDKDTFLAYPDFDASPTKLWMIQNRAKNKVEEAAPATLFALAVGKRSNMELYDIKTDPSCVQNLLPQKQGVADELHERLITFLKE